MSTAETDAELLARLTADEERLVLDRFDEDDAWRLGCLLVERARAAGLPVAVAIRRNGQRLFHAALPGSAADHDAWAQRKMNVVDRFNRSSYLVGTRWRLEGGDFDTHSRLDTATFAAHGGAFPIRVRGVGVVGAVAVSGLPQDDDHALVVEVLGEFLASAG
ncbi:heme-degrading domain-containing protein [Kineococcus sp. SYSU DK001]|uniref:heme-degrading domain-containing protein n=1 Tax=Kineococcus sp. SYSU DK001 TaxID=3383122 RepID=UPI003D7C8C1D